MTTSEHNERRHASGLAPRDGAPQPKRRWVPGAISAGIRWLLLAAFLAGGYRAVGGDAPLTKYQVEALFLYNFAKYVDWPESAFTATNAPITIGVVGTDPFGDSLTQAVEGKTIKGRSFLVRHLTADQDVRGCQMLFISDSESAQVGRILERTSKLPILTIGESDAFAQNGGIIHFVLRDEKVRLEIDLSTVKQTGMTISSRLLAVADKVTGKTN